MAEIWFCFVDVKYYDEDVYVPRHGKMICRVHSIAEALEEVTNHIGNSIEEIKFTWAKNEEKNMPKQELFFSESEFAAFDMIKHVIEHDHSLQDSKEIVEKHKREEEMKIAFQRFNMRDPKRIGEVLAAIGDIWSKYPDLRLGQLIMNVFGDPYYVEDEELISKLREYYNSISDQEV